MPSSSKKQHNFMAAVAHSPSFAKKVGVSQRVGRDFTEADKGKQFMNPRARKKGGALRYGAGGDIPQQPSPKMKRGISITKISIMPLSKAKRGPSDNETQLPDFIAKEAQRLKKLSGVKKMARGGMAGYRRMAGGGDTSDDDSVEYNGTRRSGLTAEGRKALDEANSDLEKDAAEGSSKLRSKGSGVLYPSSDDKPKKTGASDSYDEDEVSEKSKKDPTPIKKDRTFLGSLFTGNLSKYNEQERNKREQKAKNEYERKRRDSGDLMEGEEKYNYDKEGHLESIEKGGKNAGEREFSYEQADREARGRRREAETSSQHKTDPSRGADGEEKVAEKPKSQSFKEAFRAAKGKTFTWNGKKYSGAIKGSSDSKKGGDSAPTSSGRHPARGYNLHPRESAVDQAKREGFSFAKDSGSSSKAKDKEDNRPAGGLFNRKLEGVTARSGTKSDLDEKVKGIFKAKSVGGPRGSGTPSRSGSFKAKSSSRSGSSSSKSESALDRVQRSGHARYEAMKKEGRFCGGGSVKRYAAGGMVSSRADGIAVKGRTRCKIR